MRMGKVDLAGMQFRKAAKLDPRNFDTNHNLGEFYVRSGKVAAAVPFLAQAQKIDPSSYDNGYDLSLAYVLTGQARRCPAVGARSVEKKEHRGTA